MKILVYGAGAVGGYLGARMDITGHDVTLITRQFTADAINANGLSLTETGQLIHTRPNAVSSVHQAFMRGQADYDLIVMSMKAYDLKSAIDPLVAFCPEPPTIITIQNGIDVEKPLIEQYGADRIVAGSLTTPISKDTINSLTVARKDRGLSLSPTRSRQEIDRWVDLFKQSGIKTTKVADYQSMKWSKALLNIVANASAAILNRTPGIIYKSNAMFNLEVCMLQEALAVMEKQDIKVINLPGSPASWLATALRRIPLSLLKPLLTNMVHRGRGGKMPSFQLDLASGKGKSEVIYHNGAIALAGQKHGVPTPVNQALNDVLLKLTREEVDWREYDGKPKKLLMEVKRNENSAK